MSKQDRGGVRTAQQLEQKYNMGGMSKETKQNSAGINRVELEFAEQKQETDIEVEALRNEVATLRAQVGIVQSLDISSCTYAGSFAWSEETYPGSVNPNLDGKPVLILVTKDVSGDTQYGFVSLYNEVIE